MQNTKDRIMQNPRWAGVLIGFENQIGSIEIDKINGYYTIFPKGSVHIVDNLLTTLEMTSIESVVSFLQGAMFIACQNGKERFKEN